MRGGDATVFPLHPGSDLGTESMIYPHSGRGDAVKHGHGSYRDKVNAKGTIIVKICLNISST